MTREIDLIEEVARIYGYEQIPEDVAVPMAASTKRREDRVLEKIRGVLTAAGIDEALTLSVVEEPLSAAFSPWTDAEPLRTFMPVIRGANFLRRSLIPSLLAARKTNESLSNPEIELFEIAKIYLPRPKKLPDEQVMLGITSGRDFFALKGIVESLVQRLKCSAELTAADADLPLLDPDQSCRLELGGKTLGYLGKLRPEGLKQFDLRGQTTVAELKLSLLYEAANLMPQYVAAAALSGRDPRHQPRGRRVGPLGGNRRNRPRQRRAVLRGTRIPRHLPRCRTPRGGQKKPPDDPLSAVEGRHADQPASRRTSRAHRRRLPGQARCGTPGSTSSNPSQRER